MLIQYLANAIEIDKVDWKQAGESRTQLPSDEEDNSQRKNQSNYKKTPAEYIHLLEPRAGTENGLGPAQSPVTTEPHDGLHIFVGLLHQRATSLRPSSAGSRMAHRLSGCHANWRLHLESCFLKYTNDQKIAEITS
jgi:hypothetical protein